MKRTELENRIRRADWPDPSPDLRARVLAATGGTERLIGWSDRLWYSRTFRLSMAATALALIAIDQFSGVGDPARSVAPQVTAQAHAIEDASRQVGLPADAAAALSRRVVAEAALRTTGRHELPEPLPLEEPGERQ